MKTTNTYGLNMKGLRKASGETKGLNPYDNAYVQISYDRVTGEVLTDYHYSIGQNSWSVYNDSDVIKVAMFGRPATMQEIADAIYAAVNQPEFELAV